MACIKKCQIPYKIFFWLFSLQFAKASSPTALYIASSQNSNTPVSLESSYINAGSLTDDQIHWRTSILWHASGAELHIVQLYSDRLYKNRHLIAYSVGCTDHLTAARRGKFLFNICRRLTQRARSWNVRYFFELIMYRKNVKHRWQVSKAFLHQQLKCEKFSSRYFTTSLVKISIICWPLNGGKKPYK